jgi:SNF2 family DNA or RNA helicase
MSEDKKLYRHQKQGIRKLLDLDGCGLNASEVGTGKSRMTIETISHLPDIPRRIIIVAPLEAYGVWRNEIHKWAPGVRILDCTRGSIQRRARKLQKLRLANLARSRIYVIVGYESYWREPLRAEVLKWEPEVMVYDEVHRVKGRKARQSKFAHSLATPENKIHTPAHIIGLTGTPAPNGPEDYFSVFKAIDPSVFGTRWIDFEQRYIKKGGYLGFQIVGYDHLDELEEKIQAHSFRVTKAEALDLPPQVDVPIPVELSPKARTYYDELMKHAIVEIEGIQGRGTAISKIVLTNILRLQQITSGFLKVEEDGGKIIDFAEDKQNVLEALLEDVLPEAKRAVVFCRWRHDVDATLATLRGMQVQSYWMDGRVDRRDREAQLAWFRTFEPAVLVAQIKVASLSIDLTCAHIGIFLSPDYSLLNFDQARGRLHRHGQTQKVTYYTLAGRNTIDEKIYAVLEKKQNLMKLLLDKNRRRQFFS